MRPGDPTLANLDTRPACPPCVFVPAAQSPRADWLHREEGTGARRIHRVVAAAGHRHRQLARRLPCRHHSRRPMGAQLAQPFVRTHGTSPAKPRPPPPLGAPSTASEAAPSQDEAGLAVLRAVGCSESQRPLEADTAPQAPRVPGGCNQGWMGCSMVGHSQQTDYSAGRAPAHCRYRWVVVVALQSPRWPRAPWSPQAARSPRQGPLNAPVQRTTLRRLERGAVGRLEGALSSLPPPPPRCRSTCRRLCW
jgi:hypothetical protein